jgi:hypothetical protein
LFHCRIVAFVGWMRDKTSTRETFLCSTTSVHDLRNLTGSSNLPAYA